MNLDRCAALLADLEPVRIRGRVRQAIGLVVQAEGLAERSAKSARQPAAGSPARSSGSATS